MPLKLLASPVVRHGPPQLWSYNSFKNCTNYKKSWSKSKKKLCRNIKTSSSLFVVKQSLLISQWKKQYVVDRTEFVGHLSQNRPDTIPCGLIWNFKEVLRHYQRTLKYMHDRLLITGSSNLQVSNLSLDPLTVKMSPMKFIEIKIGY